MDLATSQFLIFLYGQVDIFLVVFARVLGLFIVLPVMAGQNIPLMARIGLSLSVALIAFTSNAVVIPEYTFSIVGFGMLVLQEFATGLILGFVVMMFFSMFHFVGQMVDYQMGFSMVSVLDPIGQTQTPVTGNIYYLLVSVFFIATGAMHQVLGVFFESFSVLGIGEAFIIGNLSLPGVLLGIIIEYFWFGLRIAMPVVGALITIDFVLGILVKAVPQMNVFVIGLPLKVFLGTLIVYLTMPLMSDAFAEVMNSIIAYILGMINLMIPG